MTPGVVLVVTFPVLLVAMLLVIARRAERRRQAARYRLGESWMREHRRAGGRD